MDKNVLSSFQGIPHPPEGRCLLPSFDEVREWIDSGYYPDWVIPVLENDELVKLERLLRQAERENDEGNIIFLTNAIGEVGLEKFKRIFGEILNPLKSNGSLKNWWITEVSRENSRRFKVMLQLNREKSYTFVGGEAAITKELKDSVKEFCGASGSAI